MSVILQSIDTFYLGFVLSTDPCPVVVKRTACAKAEDFIQRGPQRCGVVLSKTSYSQ